jgi:hypothetical protein
MIIIPNLIWSDISNPTIVETVLSTFWAIISLLFLVYFIISIIYRMDIHWQWIYSYAKNFGKANYKKEYQTKLIELNESLKSQFLEEKLKSNTNLDINEIYRKEENEIYSKLKKEYISKFIKKNKTINTANVDDNISILEQEFDKLIYRKTTPIF